MTNFHQYSETNRLCQVILGRYDTYCRVPEYIERVNPEQRKGLPTIEKLKDEMEKFRAVLEDEGVEVFIPEPVGKFVYDQLTPRDLGVTIGKRYLICNMSKKIRRYEVAGIFKFIDQLAEQEPNIIIPDSPTALMEGGDIIIDKGKIYVAETNRTNQEGIEFLEKTFGDEFKVIPIQVNSEGNILHLDCIFNPAGNGYALVYEPAFTKIPSEMKADYELLPVTRAEQQALATNFLSLSKNKVISSKNTKRVNALLKERDIEVIEIPFDAVNATGGSLRCASLPLVRRT